MKKTIDIIIPAYNAHGVIDKTLYSIAYQTKVSNLNVLIINDGSDTDYSKEINYFSKFMSIKELTLKKNKGAGYARQYGIDNSTSKYICFINAGDMLLSPIAMQLFELKANQSAANIIVSNIEIEKENGYVEKSDNELISLCGKLYKRDFLEKNNIKFSNEKENNYIGFNMLAFLHDAKVETINDYTYLKSYNEYEKKTIIECYDNVFSYFNNIEYALKTAIKHNCNKTQIAYFAYNTLVSAYYYYLEFPEQKYQERLLKETIKTYNVFKEYNVTEEQKNEIWNSIVLIQLQGINVMNKMNPSISFENFLKQYKHI